MFERFTDRARRTIVLAQEEARRLQHNYIGTEHLLLGLLRETDGFAARAVSRFGLDLAAGRDDVLSIIGLGKKEPKGHIPFTPRAKKCLELSLRESLAIGHDYIGTEHIMLGIVKEGDGVAARILEKHAGSLAAVRAAVLEQLPAEEPAGQRRRWLLRLAGQRTTAATTQQEPAELHTTPAADMSLAEAAQLAGAGPVGSHHILLAALADADSAAARALSGLGVDLDRVREALRTADVTGSSDELPEEAGRRQMLLRVAADRITVDVSDPTIVALGRAALEAVAARAAESGQQAEDRGAEGVVRGDDPLGASLSLVWQALHDSLEDIRSRAATAAEAPPEPPSQSAAADG